MTLRLCSAVKNSEKSPDGGKFFGFLDEGNDFFSKTENEELFAHKPQAFLIKK
jgi:hypothetical protein